MAAVDRGADVGVSSVLYVQSGPHRSGVMERLTRMGIGVTRAESLADALKLAAEHTFSLCLVDLADDHAAVPSIRAIRGQHAHLAVAGLMDPSHPILAAEAIHAGAADLLPWPFDEHDVAALLANAHDRVSVGHLDGVAQGPDPLFAHSPAMRQVVELVRAAAASRHAVLLIGEAGSGREMIARAIHSLGPQPHSPFVPVSCLAGPSDDVEERLFGVAADRAQTQGKSRVPDRIGSSGAVYQARGGTLYLASLVDAPARVQAKLARLTRDREAFLVDKRTTVDLDVRAMGAVDAEFEAALSDGRLRRDIYERLGHLRIEVPALRRRREDIPLLAVHLLRELRQALGAPAQQFSRSALALLSALPWPGNGRELRALVEAIVRSVDGPVIQLDDLLAHVKLDGVAPRIDASGSLRDARMRFERDWISSVLMRHQGKVGDAARALGIQRTNLYRKVRQLKVARTLLARKA
jgi:two-component system response regulator PilR (NtrC family)